MYSARQFRLGTFQVFKQLHVTVAIILDSTGLQVHSNNVYATHLWDFLCKN